MFSKKTTVGSVELRKEITVVDMIMNRGATTEGNAFFQSQSPTRTRSPNRAKLGKGMSYVAGIDDDPIAPHC